MTPAEITLVQLSFSAVMPQADRLAQRFYALLFQAEPSLRPLFADDMAEQRRKLMLTLTTVIQQLHHLDPILPVIRSLAVRHVRYGTHDRHYAVVGDALLGALDEQDGFGADHRAAWASAYGVLSGAMIAAARDAR